MSKPEVTETLIPEVGFMRLPKVLAVIPISRSTLYVRIKEGKFPKPMKLSSRVSAWRVEDIRRFIEEQSSSDALN